jgi:hypothetical protein
MTEIDLLFERLKKIDESSYPDGMYPIQGGISVPAFYPGGKGTYDNSGKISDKKIMILGQDFGSRNQYLKLKERGRENIKKNKTWGPLLSFLDELQLEYTNCFFTNAILGVREGNMSVGRSLAFKDPKFISICQDFFLYQLEIQKPTTILVLGKEVAKFLGPLSEELKLWKSMISFKLIDQNGKQCIRNVVFKNNISANLALLTHPSYRKLNAHWRYYMNFEGFEAELKMVKDIL